MKIRPAVLSDVDDVIRVCDLSWKGIWQGERSIFIDRILAFPECGIIVGEVNGRIEGYVSVQLIDSSKLLGSTWDEETDFGHIRGTHNPDGDWLHGVGLAVTPEGCRAGLTGELIRFLFDYAVANNKRGCRFVTRMPGYYRYHHKMSPEEYALCQHDGKAKDPELRVLGSYGFKVVKPPVIIKDYVNSGGDPKSCGFSVLIEQLNPFWKEDNDDTS